MRVATFNVESFFMRARALKSSDRALGAPILDAFAAINVLLGKETYSAADKQKILDLLDQLGLLHSDDAHYASLRQNHGHLLTRHPGGDVEVTAAGRASWIGWVELVREPVDELSTRHAAMVLRDVGADVQAFVEVENRIALKEFSDGILPDVGGTTYDHLMLIDGNDPRGIDVAIGTRNGHDLGGMRSHVDDADAHGGLVFSRDCPEYQVVTPGGGHLLVLVNHLKSKGFGSQQENDARRHEQAQRVADIYAQRRAEGEDKVVVLGDFNDTLDGEPLAPLLATDLHAVEAHPAFDDGGRPGTYANCTASQDIDHILLSPALWQAVRGGGIFRMGAWGGKNGTLWPHYDTIEAQVQAASDHCAVFVDLEVA